MASKKLGSPPSRFHVARSFTLSDREVQVEGTRRGVPGVLTVCAVSGGRTRHDRHSLVAASTWGAEKDLPTMTSSSSSSS